MITKLTDQSASAPALTGAAGSLLAVLNWCLVTNLGWTKTHTATNKGAFRAPTGRRMYLGVDDSATLSTRLRGYETASAAGVASTTGGPFPTNAQVSGGYWFQKGVDTTSPVPWSFYSNGTFFYLFTELDPVDGNITPHMAFGDFGSYAAVDNYNAVLCGATSVDSAQSFMQGAGYMAHAAPRAISQVAGGIFLERLGTMRGSYGGLGSLGVAYPDPVSGKLLASRIELYDIPETPANVRGFMPGLYEPLHASPFVAGDTFTGSGDLAGRTFEVRKAGSNSVSVLIETSDTWLS